jgi:Tol biopolymer transport system component
MKGMKIMSNENNQVQVFEQQHMQVFKQLADITKTKKQLEDQEKKVKADLEKAMDAYDIKSIDNQFLKITRVNGSTSTSIDLKALEEKEPKLYGELLEDYPKVTTKKSYLTFKVK